MSRIYKTNRYNIYTARLKEVFKELFPDKFNLDKKQTDDKPYSALIEMNHGSYIQTVARDKFPFYLAIEACIKYNISMDKIFFDNLENLNTSDNVTNFKKEVNNKFSNNENIINSSYKTIYSINGEDNIKLPISLEKNSENFTFHNYDNKIYIIDKDEGEITQTGTYFVTKDKLSFISKFDVTLFDGISFIDENDNTKEKRRLTEEQLKEFSVKGKVIYCYELT